MAMDPVGQYYSPYIAFGNNSINRTDPSGGIDWPFGIAEVGYSSEGWSGEGFQPGPRSVVTWDGIWQTLEGGGWIQTNFLEGIEIRPTDLQANGPIAIPMPPPPVGLPGWASGLGSATGTLISWGSSIFAASAVLKGDKSEKYITLYRGVSVTHPDYPSALDGMATPRGGHSDPARHNNGDTNSIFTSWSTAKDVAKFYAMKHGPGGVHLEKKFKFSQIVPSPDAYNEGEVLIPGIVRGAKPTILK